jgi:hypothetical protein
MRHNKHNVILNEITYDFDYELAKIFVLIFGCIFTLLNIA